MRYILLFMILITLSLEAEIKSEDVKTNIQSEVTDEEFEDEFEDEFNLDNNTNNDDPLSGYNKMMTNFNDSAYENVLFPVARSYNDVMPKTARVGISNFFDNLRFPINFVNNILQLKFQNALEETGRFITNTTIGVLGFSDQATSLFDLKKHEEDFGQTLGHYGLGGGYYFVMPILGPSNTRDMLGMVVDWQIDPFFYQEGRSYNLLTKSFIDTVAIKSVDLFNDLSLNIDKYENLKKDAIELYPLLKNVYTQYRNEEIKK